MLPQAHVLIMAQRRQGGGFTGGRHGEQERFPGLGGWGSADPEESSGGPLTASGMKPEGLCFLREVKGKAICARRGRARRRRDESGKGLRELPRIM